MEKCSRRAAETQTEEEQGAKAPQRTGRRNHGEKIAAQQNFAFKRTATLYATFHPMRINM